MAISMYSSSVPVFVRMLNNLSSWLDKAQAHAIAKKFDPSVLLTTRIAPDMFPLLRQVQISCDMAKFCVARLSGEEAPKFEDQETTFDELHERIRKTLSYVEAVSASKLDGTEEKTITVPRRDNNPYTFKGEFYLKHFALPNLYFHLTTTYALLRHNGVDIGKGDFLGSFQ